MFQGEWSLEESLKRGLFLPLTTKPSVNIGLSAIDHDPRYSDWHHKQNFLFCVYNHQSPALADVTCATRHDKETYRNTRVSLTAIVR